MKPCIVRKPVIDSNDNIIWGHPGLGKTTFKNKNPNLVLDFDTDFKPEVAKRLGLPKDKRNSKSLNEWRENNSEEDFKTVMREVWKEAVQEAKTNKKLLVVSDMMFLRENENDFDKIITTSKEKFIKRATKRGDNVESLNSWKNNIDKTIKSVDKNKIISTDEYFSDLFSKSAIQVTAPNGKPSKLFNDLTKFLGDEELALKAWARIYTKEFQDWFKDSKVLDENGEPKLVYLNNNNTNPDIFAFTDEQNSNPMFLSIQTPQQQQHIETRQQIAERIFDQQPYLSTFSSKEEYADYLGPTTTQPGSLKDIEEFEKYIHKNRELSDTKLKSVYFKDGNVQPHTVILQRIIDEGHVLAPLAEKLLSLPSMDISIEASDTAWNYVSPYSTGLKGQTNNKNGGQYFNNKVIMPLRAFYKNNDSVPIILHEIIHGYTVDEIGKNTPAVKQLNEIYQQALKNSDQFSEEYPLTNLKEFIVAVYTNSSFIKDIQAMPSINKGKSLWEDLMNAFKTMFNFNQEERTLFDDAMYSSNQVLEDYSKKAPYQKKLDKEAALEHEKLAQEIEGLFDEDLEQMAREQADYEDVFDPAETKEGVNLIFEENPELSKIGTKEQYSEYIDTIFPDSKVKDIVYHGRKNIVEEFIFEKDFKGKSNQDWKLGISFSNSKKVAEQYGRKINPAIVDVTNQKELFTESVDVKTEEDAIAFSYHAEGFYPIRETIKNLNDLPIGKHGIVVKKEGKLKFVTVFKKDGEIYVQYRSSGKIKKVEKNAHLLLESYNQMVLKNNKKAKIHNEKFEGVDTFVTKNLFDGAIDIADTYQIRDPKRIHILGSEKDIQGFKEFTKSKKQNTPQYINPQIDSNRDGVITQDGNYAISNAEQAQPLFNSKDEDVDYEDVFDPGEDIEFDWSSVKSEFKNYLDFKKSQIIELRNRLARIKTIKKNLEKNIAVPKVAKAFKTLSKIQKTIEDRIGSKTAGTGLLGEIFNLEENKTLFSVYNMANQDFERLETLLSNKNLNLVSDIEEANGIIQFYIRMAPKLDGKDNHPLFTKDQLFIEGGGNNYGAIPKEVFDYMKELKARAEEFENQLDERKQRYVEKVVNENKNVKSIHDIKKDSKLKYDEIVHKKTGLKDAHWLDKMFMDMTMGAFSSNGMIPQVAFAVMQAHEDKKLQEANNLHKNLDEMYPKVEEALRKLGQGLKLFSGKIASGVSYDMFKQVNSIGLETGKLVHRYATSFFDSRENMENVFRVKLNIAKKEQDINKKKKLYKEAFAVNKQWHRENTIPFELGKLPDIFDNAEFAEFREYFDESNSQEHVDLLQNTISRKGYKEEVAKQVKLLRRFMAAKKVQKEMVKDGDLTTQEYIQWEKVNNPFLSNEYHYNDSNIENLNENAVPSMEYNISIPRKKKVLTEVDNDTKDVSFVELNEEFDYYDDKYKDIENDKTLYDFHLEMTKVLKQIRKGFPAELQKDIGINSLMAMEKTVTEILLQSESIGDKFSKVRSKFWEGVKDVVSVKEQSKFGATRINPATGKPNYEINAQFIKENSSKIRTLEYVSSLELSEILGIEEITKFTKIKLHTAQVQKILII